jgi:hypothetical protein
MEGSKRLNSVRMVSSADTYIYIPISVSCNKAVLERFPSKINEKPITVL